jgi:hypothetical protein
VKGRRPATTREQRARVVELVDAGVSQRAVAELVFGDRGLRGRVQRILVAERVREAREHDPEQRAPSAAELAERLARDVERRLGAGERVSPGDVLALSRLERVLENQRTVERLNALTRER